MRPISHRRRHDPHPLAPLVCVAALLAAAVILSTAATLLMIGVPQ